jgi:hypothetical protein
MHRRTRTESYPNRRRSPVSPERRDTPDSMGLRRHQGRRGPLRPPLLSQHRHSKSPSQWSPRWSDRRTRWPPWQWQSASRSTSPAKGDCRQRGVSTSCPNHTLPRRPKTSLSGLVRPSTASMSKMRSSWLYARDHVAHDGPESCQLPLEQAAMTDSPSVLSP